MLYLKGEHIVSHIDHAEHRSPTNGIMPASPVVTLTAGTYDMDLVLRTKVSPPKDGAPRKKGAERGRWTNRHSGMHILGMEDTKHDHCGCAEGVVNPA
jgi:hypothetical protein